MRQGAWCKNIVKNWDKKYLHHHSVGAFSDVRQFGVTGTDLKYLSPYNFSIGVDTWSTCSLRHFHDFYKTATRYENLAQTEMLPRFSIHLSAVNFYSLMRPTKLVLTEIYRINCQQYLIFDIVLLTMQISAATFEILKK